jgi:ribosomal protein L40E
VTTDRSHVHVWLPAQGPLAAELGAVERVIRAIPGWAAAIGNGEGNDGYRVWRHSDSGAVLLAVAVGLDPLVISIGQAPDVAAQASGEWAAGRTVREAVAAVRRAVPGLGGREVADWELLPLVRQARERLEWRVRAEARAEALQRRMGQRVCPSCGSWSRYQARWCRSCRYEFAPSDNLARDEAREAAERELAELAPQLHSGAAPAQPGATA